jgi:glycosyltransferase involved in cell wall biosynthesis
MRPYKILHVEYRDYVHPEAGGAEVVLREVYQRLSRQGHQVDYLTSLYPGASAEEMMDGARMLRTGNKWNFNWAAPAYYKKHLEKNNYDIIIEGIDKIPFFFPLYTKTPVLPLVPHLFGTTAFEEAPFPAAAYVWLMEQFIPYVYRKCPYYLTYSLSTRDDLIKRGIPGDIIHVAYIALNHDLFKPAIDNTTRHPHSLAYVGRIKRYKFIDHGIQVVARLKKEYPDIIYHIVGRGDNLEALKKMAADLKVEENVKFWGFVDEETKVKILQESQIVLYNSVKEGWGLTAIEANACGTPVIASNSPGLREAVSDGKTGFLIEHGNLDQLETRIRQIFDSKEEQLRLQQGSLEWANSFNWDKTAAKFLEFIEKTLEAKAK